MNNEPLPPKGGDNAAWNWGWAVVGLLPIPVLLSLIGPDRRIAPVVVQALVILVPLCNLAGAIGCTGAVKNLALRIVLSIVLGAVFFVLTCIVVLFQACSRTNI